MNLNHLRAFHLVALHGSYTAAALAAGVSQPTLSEHVRKLQQEHGTLLLRRTAGGMEPTGQGSALLQATLRLFGAEREAEQLLSIGIGHVKGLLRFGADAPIHAVPALQRLRASHPGIKISLHTGNSTSIRTAVANGSMDIGIVADPAEHALLAVRLLSSQDLVAVVPHGSALANSKAASLQDLHATPLVIREKGSVTRSATEAALARRNVHPSQLTEAYSRESVEAAVLAGLGTGLMGEAEFSHDPRLALVDLADGLDPLNEYVIHRVDRQGEPVIAAALAASFA